jgi:hypothetical protein
VIKGRGKVEVKERFQTRPFVEFWCRVQRVENWRMADMKKSGMNRIQDTNQGTRIMAYTAM